GASAAFTQRVVDRFLARRRWRRSIRSAAILLAGIGIALLLTRPSDPEGTPPPPGQQLARLEAEYVTLAAELRQLTALTEQTHLRVWLASGEAFDITLDPRDLAPAVGGAVPAALPTREPGGLP